MGFKIYLLLYILSVASVSLLSYKKGICLIWISFLFIPTIILETNIKLRAETILMLGSIISELRFRKRRVEWIKFFTDHRLFISVFFTVSVMIVFLSETVPIKHQLKCVIDEIAFLLFAVQTFMFVKGNQRIARSFIIIVCVAIIFNFVYCIIFEVIIGLNPAGMPLYILMGVDDNDFISDMIDYERGELSFRAQTIYRHPLSLGQYLLALLPIFLSKRKFTLRFIFIAMICILVILTGSRSSLFPLIIILMWAFKNITSHVIPKMLFLLLTIIVCISFVPDRERKKVSEKVEPFVASLAFWDDKKQSDNDIKGSSMEMRLNQFDAALKEIEGNPIFGRGYWYRDYYISKHNALHPDLLGFESVLLLQLVERGWLGLFTFFFLIFYLYRQLEKSSSEKPVIRYIFFGFIISILMTGVRPLSLLFVCLSSTIVCGMSSTKIIRGQCK